MARLVQPINLQDLTEEGLIFQVEAKDVNDCESSEEENGQEILEKKLQYINCECIGVFDEDTYEEGEPFQIIARKMFNLLPNGKIKKKIVRAGNGERPMEFASVTINYNGYLEYNDQPFDSTYVRNKPLKFVINNGKVIPGLDYAVQSMKLDEKSQFLIHPDYAYGKNCFIGRIPPNAQVLFEVELIGIVNTGATITYEKLSEEEQKKFPEVYKYCMALCEKGKKLFVKHDFKNAIKDYNTAVAKLEKVFLNSKGEVEKHRELSLKLHSNLLICYTLTHKPRKGCYNAKKIYDFTENGELMKIPAKVYFNHAKCLRVLSEYDNAKAILNKAYKMESKNPEIINEMLNLEKDIIEHKKKQRIFAKALVGNN